MRLKFLNPVINSGKNLLQKSPVLASSFAKLGDRRVQLAIAGISLGMVAVTVAYRLLRSPRVYVTHEQRTPPKLLQIEFDSAARYDVVEIGGGPTGLTLACLLKALDPNLRVCVLDKREETTRNFGLSLDSLHPLIGLLKKLPKERQEDPQVQALLKTYSSWQSAKFARTKDIEDKLTELAVNMGVTVFRGSAFGVTDTVDENKVVTEKAADKLNRLISGSDLQDQNEENLHNIFSEAQVVVGADGARSVTRELIGAKKTDEVELNWVIQLKYQVKGLTPKKGLLQNLIFGTKGPISISSRSGKVEDGYKPATMQIFVTKDVCDAFVQRDKNKKVIKGDSANAWTLEEIATLAESNSDVRSVYQIMVRELALDEDRAGAPCEAKVSILPIALYRCNKAVDEVAGKQIAVVGDAFAGLALRRGANNGQKSAALLAQAIIDYRNGNQEALAQYQQEVTAMTINEMWWVKWRAKGLDMADTLLMPVRPVARVFGRIIGTWRTPKARAALWSSSRSPN